MSVSRNNAPAVSYPSGVFAFYRPLNLALWGITAMIGVWVWSHSNATLSQVGWLLLLLAWLVIGLMVAFIPNRFKVGDLQWSGRTDEGWNWQPAIDSITIGFSSKPVQVRVQCIWRSHSHMLLTIRSMSLVGFAFPPRTTWLWMKADARPGQWPALCRALCAHAQT